MAKSQEKLLKIVSKLPSSPGVYKFINTSGKILYIGKATSLKNRVRSYFTDDIAVKRSELIRLMVDEARDIKYEKTDSVLEALILEAELIKKHLPHYNSIGKDQRSWNYVIITKEEFPRVLTMRARELEQSNVQIIEKFGPFTHGAQLREALKIVRRIFPYRDKCTPLTDNVIKNNSGCFNHQIGLCPGMCAGKIDSKEYQKTIRQIIKFFKGKKQSLLKDIQREMRTFAKEKQFEKANESKNKLFALKHIEDIALIKRDRPELQVENQGAIFRIEAYDIAHISGTNMVGVMTVVENDEPKNSEYRMFKIKGQKGVDDTRAISEILNRRLNHTEWLKADLIVIDGGVAQLNTSKLILEERGVRIPLVAVTKDSKHKPIKIIAATTEGQNMITKHQKSILLANSESHRFAINFHRRLRNKQFEI